MKVNVDFDLCASTGGCMQICPEVFEVRSDGYLYVLQEEPPARTARQGPRGRRPVSDRGDRSSRSEPGTHAPCEPGTIGADDLPRAARAVVDDVQLTVVCRARPRSRTASPTLLDSTATRSSSSARRSSMRPPTSSARSSPRSPTSRRQRAEDALERICTYIRDDLPRRHPVLDAKRGDIGSTAEHYAREAFGRYGAHAVTVNPYLGDRFGAPLLRARRRRHRPVPHEQPGRRRPAVARLRRRTACTSARRRMVATSGASHGECALVVGATYPGELARVREVARRPPDPGARVSAHQGGDPQAAVKAGARDDGRGLMISSSRAILYASSTATTSPTPLARRRSRPASPRLPAGW